MMFENREQKNIFGLKRDEGIGQNCITRTYDLYSSQSIIRIMKSRNMRWAGNLVPVGGKMN
jgi:hypothetical protein